MVKCREFTPSPISDATRSWIFAAAHSCEGPCGGVTNWNNESRLRTVNKGVELLNTSIEIWVWVVAVEVPSKLFSFGSSMEELSYIVRWWPLVDDVRKEDFVRIEARFDKHTIEE